MKKLLFTSTLVSSIMMSGMAYGNEQISTLKNTNLVRETRIIDGEKTEAGRYPFMTALLRAADSNISPFCGASFIGEKYVLTAAHCIQNVKAESINVWIGGHDTTKPDGGKRVKVSQIYLHEEYNDVPENKDIAILELAENVEGVEPIKLVTPEMDMSIAEGDELTVMGWGNTNPDSSENPIHPDVLLEVMVPRYNRQACVDAFAAEDSSESVITEFMFCAGLVEGGKDSCQGDSGGPLIIERNNEFFQAGVVSFGSGCAEANSPGIYSRVSKFIDWIKVKRDGVSYRQNNNVGFVESNYEEVVTFEINNIGSEAFAITSTEITNEVNMAEVNITDNQCEGVNLTKGMSCSIVTNAKVNGVGEGKFTIIASSNSPEQEKANMTYTLNALEQDSLDLPALIGENASLVSWYAGGDAKWEPQTTKVAEGDNAIASGDITDAQASILLAVVDNNRPSSVNMKVAVSSEEGYDVLSILLNGEEEEIFSGSSNADFRDVSINLESGKNRISIVYQKDDSEKDGDDKAYLDAFSMEISNKAPEARVKQAEITVEEETQFTLDASDSIDADNDTLSYKWELVGDGTITIDTPNSATTTVTAPKASVATSMEFKVTVTDEFNSSSEAQVKVTINAKAVVTPAPAPAPAPAPRPSNNARSGGSITWLTLLLAAALIVTRRIKL